MAEHARSPGCGSPVDHGRRVGEDWAARVLLGLVVVVAVLGGIWTAATWLPVKHGRRAAPGLGGGGVVLCGTLAAVGWITGGGATWLPVDYGRRVRVLRKTYGFTVGLENSVRFSGGCFAVKWAFGRSLCGTKYFAGAFQVPNARRGLFAALTFAWCPNAVRFSFPAALRNTLQVI